MCIISSEETDRLSGLPESNITQLSGYVTLRLYNPKSHTCPTIHTNNNNTIYHVPILNQKL